MKKLMGIGLALSVSFGCAAQQSTETITREIKFEKRGTNNALMIFNINGPVKVETHAGSNVLVEVKKTITAKTDERLQMGKTEIGLGVLDRADTVMLYVTGVCSEFGKLTRKFGRQRYNGWGYNWNDCGRNRDCDKKYDYKMEFTIKVPADVSVAASTINQGSIELTGMRNAVIADNVNGSITLRNISGGTYASTINGSVDLEYAGNPPSDSRYYSLNGDIHANFKKGLAARLTFKSFNGDFYSDIDDIVPMAVEVEKVDQGEGIKYKVNGNRYKVRQGGPLLDFETFNGDVFLTEK